MTAPLYGPSSSPFRGLIGVAREDITPPVGIHARCWGAATHEVAEGVHRPLTLTCMSFQAREANPPLVLIAADLMSWRSRTDEWLVRSAILTALELDEARLMFCFSHTHAAPSLRSDDAARPGGHLIEPYRDLLRNRAISAARTALSRRRVATLDWRYGRCDLAANRDLREAGGDRMLCGFNPATRADDALLVGRISDSHSGKIIATIVNYACHPTTLGWQNTLMSPDYVGAMRETVEGWTGGAPCLFLQGASGELAPAQQYTDEVAVADRHGRQLGFAILSVLEAMDPPATRLAYQGTVASGAALAIWRHAPAPLSDTLAAEMTMLDLPLKPLPTAAQLEADWQTADDMVVKERLWRKRQVRKIVGDGPTARMPLWAWRLGDAFLVGQPNEAYSRFQTNLRTRLAPRAVAVMNLVNGSAGYLAPRELYSIDAYPISQSPFAAGALEHLIAAAETILTKSTFEGADHV